ncbi:MAG: universal stress protein, partial [Caldimicrobium sp.]
MGKYKKILVPIDGSESSLHALYESFKLAKNEGSWITALCVIPPYLGDLSLITLQNIYNQMKKPCEEALKKAKELSSQYGVLIKTELEEGEPHERIVDFAEATNCDLIVMGRHGLSKLEKMLLGSVTARVIGYTTIDVLVVPRSGSIEFHNILLATDGSQFSRVAEKKAIDLAKSYGGKLTLLSVI